jgi:glycosyltransferase involved in cell wall biosynthesis
MKMRITFVLPAVGLGGGSRVIAMHARELLRLGHKVHLVSQPRKRVTLQEKLRLWSLCGGSTGVLKSHFDGAGLDHRTLEYARPVTDNDLPDADIVVATWWETAEWVQALSPMKGTKVYYIQGHEVYPYLPIERCKATYRLPMHKIVVSKWLLNTIAREYDDNIVDLVPNSVDHAQFFAADRNKQPVPTVGCLYSSIPIKGFSSTAAAINVVRARFPNLRIICFASERARWGSQIPVGAEFHFSPHQDHLRNLYSSCDVWVTASTSEGFNLPAMEAMACRTPVVATRTGWPEEAVNSGSNGVLVNVGDVDALAQGIEWVLSQNNENWRAISASAYATVEKSSWEASTKLFEAALKRACKRAKRGEVAGNCEWI